MALSPSHSGVSSSSDDEAPPAAPASFSVIQGVSIRHHVPVILDMDEGNYGQWRLFFDSMLGKFGLRSHARNTTPTVDRDGEWRMVDSCVINWILATVSSAIFDMVRHDRNDAFLLWHTIEGLFRNNELQRTVLLETELRSLQQGDMSINDYCTKLKRLADKLRDIGHPISEPSQVLNLLCSLNPRYRYVKPVITSKYPPHTFQSARSFLVLEELGAQHDANAEAGQALAATHGDSSNTAPTGAKGGSSSSSSSRSNTGGGNTRSNNRSDRRRGRGRGNNSGSGDGQRSNTSSGNNTQTALWAAGYNPWQAMVQAWPMPFRAPGAGVLGPRPPFQPQQAMTAAHQPTSSSGGAFDTSGLYAALQSAGVQHQPPSATDWYFDTGALSHMSSSPGNFHPSSLHSSSSCITVGNGA